MADYQSPMNVNVQQRARQKDSDSEMSPPQGGTQQAPQFPLLGPSMASTVGAYVFNTGREKAQQALNIYSHIDYLRPYFDVEPKDVLNRLINSLIPVNRGNFNTNMGLVTELYGPLMIIFTLCAILIYQMKIANHAIQDGTLIGTAFFVCFSYWIGTSFLASSTSFICNSSITLFNFLSLIGYSLFSHCIVLFVGTFIHTSHDHLIFYVLWIFLSGAAGLKLASTILAHTPHPRYKIFLAIGVFVIHMSFLLYIHFAYHELAEEVSHALFGKLSEDTGVKSLSLDNQIGANNPSPYQKVIKKRFDSIRADNATSILAIRNS